MISFEIDGRRVGGGAPCYLIAEVAQSHDGDIERAHRYVDAAADSGADAVKFQTHIARHESTLDEPFRAKIPGETGRASSTGAVWSSHRSSGVSLLPTAASAD